MLSCLGIITARKGSKGIPLKNKRKLNGKPVIAYTCELAKKCKYISKTITTTDCQEIRKISKKFGVEAPFLRPKKFATDNSFQEDAVIHAINWYSKNRNTFFDYICLLEPTAPFRKLSSLNKAFKILKKNKKLDGVFSITKSNTPPNKLRIKSKNNLMSNWFKGKKFDSREIRQKSKTYYKRTSSIIIIKTDYLMKKKVFMSKKSLLYEVDQIEGIDLDEPFDFFIAEQVKKNKFNTAKQLDKYIK